MNSSPLSASADDQAGGRQLTRCAWAKGDLYIAYAFMQAVGMVNDHTTDGFRYGG